MNDTFFFDLIILIVFVVFIFSRFMSTKLPRDDDKDNKRNQSGQVIDLPSRPVVTPLKPQNKGLSAAELDKLKGADKIRAIDPSFDEKEFISGAKQAYILYWQAVADSDEGTIDALTSPRVFDDIFEKIEELEKKDKRLITRVDGFDSVDIIDTRINGKTAIVEVKYVVNQAQVEVKSSSTSTAAKAKKESVVWVLARNVDEADPNWELEDIKTIN